ncbi:MAG: DUF2089 domain-containing protein [Anaeroplasma sp.]|nr:DUF2089 domain-containing protein [Anaeroplasma sp.]
MKKNILGYCPICSNKLTAKTLRCNECDTEISGEFILSPFDFLSKEQLEFALVFIKNQGNIKMIEKQLNISYPTVKKYIDDLLKSLGFVEENQKLTREEIRQKLKNKEITFEEAEELLGGL